MPWTTSSRRSRLPKDWATRRTYVRRRANDQCELTVDGIRCPRVGHECDHVTPGDNHDPSNLQWLCIAHHKAKTQAEAQAARPSRQRPAERHPGLL